MDFWIVFGNEQADAEENSGNTLSSNISMKLVKSSIQEWLYKKSHFNLHQSCGARHKNKLQKTSQSKAQNKTIAQVRKE